MTDQRDDGMHAYGVEHYDEDIGDGAGVRIYCDRPSAFHDRYGRTVLIVLADSVYMPGHSERLSLGWLEVEARSPGMERALKRRFAAKAEEGANIHEHSRRYPAEPRGRATKVRGGIEKYERRCRCGDVLDVSAAKLEPILEVLAVAGVDEISLRALRARLRASGTTPM